ncbi:MAG: glycine betaine/L-proline ABC transporter ATP-binding protein [Epulopiscium sp.]|nr:glycine betaine/L-proline ABC transporter ATP-binding protein [Candidatus Epulonipiscium sp.]
MNNPKVSIQKVYKIFGKRTTKALEDLKNGKDKETILEETKQVIALNNISLDIMPGEVFVIMGLSGSGKSTLARCINRLIRPTSGKVLIDGKDITKMNSTQLRETRRKKMGMVFQNFGLFPHLNILDNVAYGLKIQGVEKSKRYEQAGAAIDQVGLKGWEMKYPEELSGGMQQRVGLARALANDPDILIMDEAFSALDPLIRADMQDELVDLQKIMKKTIIFITHDLDEAIKIGDRIALMKDGQVIQVGTAQDILINPADEYVSKFTENVDKNKVFTAEQIMREPTALANITDNPQDIMDKIIEKKIDSIFVVDKDNNLKGLIRRKELERAIKNKDTNITKYLDFNFTKVRKHRSLESLLAPLANSNEPIAIVSSKNKLLGIVIRSYIFEAITGGVKSE